MRCSSIAGCAVFVLWAAFAASGCNKASRPPTIPVSGEVTYDDKTLVPANTIEVRFLTPQALIDQGCPPEAVARVDTQKSTFDEATTWVHGDGVVAGENAIEVVRYGDEKDSGSSRAKYYRGDDVFPNKVVVSPNNTVFQISIRKK
jgi:hypothetical protein